MPLSRSSLALFPDAACKALLDGNADGGAAGRVVGTNERVQVSELDVGFKLISCSSWMLADEGVLSITL